jgi:hypothetical protein
MKVAAITHKRDKMDFLPKFSFSIYMLVFDQTAQRILFATQVPLPTQQLQEWLKQHKLHNQKTTTSGHLCNLTLT